MSIFEIPEPGKTNNNLLLMNKTIQCILLFLSVFSFSIVRAQQKEIPVRFANGDFATKNNIASNTFKKEDIESLLLRLPIIVKEGILPNPK